MLTEFTNMKESKKQIKKRMKLEEIARLKKQKLKAKKRAKAKAEEARKLKARRKAKEAKKKASKAKHFYKQGSIKFPIYCHSIKKLKIKDINHLNKLGLHLGSVLLSVRDGTTYRGLVYSYNKQL